jgi:phosphoesterase RecJ-like protein
MVIDQQIAADIRNTIANCQSILLVSHRNPDPDTIGSNLTLRFLIEKLGKTVVSICIDPIPPSMAFLPGVNSFVNELPENIFNLVITVDASSPAQTGLLDQNLPSLAKTIINIDHHDSNTSFGGINLVIPKAASTTLVILNLLKIWQEKITIDMATSLLAGLYSDTGSFMHSNTDQESYLAAEELMRLGAKHHPIVKNLFRNRSINQMHLWGKVLSEIRVTENKIAVGAIRQKDLQESQAELDDIAGLIDYISSTNDNDFAALLSDEGDGNIRGSLRTRKDNINVSSIAKNLGGGGHIKASGFKIKGQLIKEIRWIITPPDSTSSQAPE